MNKKAGIPDGIFYMVAMFAVAIISVVGLMILTNVGEQFDKTDAISDSGKNLFNSIKDKYVNIIDGAFLMIFVGVLIGVVVGVWFIKTHPALFWIVIPIFAFIIFLSAVYANVFHNFVNNPKIITSASQFVVIPFILNNYAYVITGAIVLIAIALFAKGKGQTNEI